MRVCLTDKISDLLLDLIARFPSIHCDGSSDFLRGR
jgi:hypothetical protein